MERDAEMIRGGIRQGLRCHCLPWSTGGIREAFVGVLEQRPWGRGRLGTGLKGNGKQNHDLAVTELSTQRAQVQSLAFPVKGPQMAGDVQDHSLLRPWRSASSLSRRY